MKQFCILAFALLALSLTSLAQHPWPADTAKPSPATRSVTTAQLQDPSDMRDPDKLDKMETGYKPQLTLPVGTAIHMKLETPLYTSSNKAGDVFEGRVTEDVKLGEKIVIPVGSALHGEVVRVAEPRRIKGKPMIQIKPQSITMPNGERYTISAVVVDTNKVNGTNVDSEGRITGKTRTTRDNIELAGGAGIGAVVGGVVDGGKGTLIGAGIGAGAAMVHWLTKHNQTSLPAGSELIFELSRPVAIVTNPR